ncbi:MAG: glucose-1-phosphate adenylyltransferase [Methylacidiphilales bacterium]|nr:glucose-1-phosphate adenylyltransferase [Candidatus Methylacidiphilales bacterium]MDW8348955.1 glucose-1-phosphate adenylyltransferase [Verrucomicrobiae bacterium]
MNPTLLSTIHSAIPRTVAVILGGGAGTRLYPLTKDRAKPAVPLAGKYRLVDIPISNCINSGMRFIYLLTQYNSASLHRHIQQTYHFEEFSRGFVQLMAAQQTPEPTSGWYQGTADAVRANLKHFDNVLHDYVLILSGDQLYRMDYRDVLAEHITRKADVTVCTIPVKREAARGFGIMCVDQEGRIKRFVEKPQTAELLDSLRLDSDSLIRLGKSPDDELYLASMGIYIFNRSVLHRLLNNSMLDFGKEVIPYAIEQYRVYSFIFQGYWEDIGTVRAFYEANLDLCNEHPSFDYGLSSAPIYTRPRNLRPNVIGSANLTRTVLCTGIKIGSANIERSLLGNRTIIGHNVKIKNTLIMGADYYEDQRPPNEFPVPLGIGDGSVISDAIIDKNVRIGKNCIITPEGKPSHFDHPLACIRDGIIVIPKGTMIPDNTVI